MISVEDLTYTYPSGSSPAIRGLTFEVEKGEVFGFLGPSGAGKTTTQNILIGLIKGWQGRVRVLNRPLAEWGAAYYRSIGVSFEAPNHYLKLSARENLEYFRSLYDGKADTVEEVDRGTGTAQSRAPRGHRKTYPVFAILPSGPDWRSCRHTCPH